MAGGLPAAALLLAIGCGAAAHRAPPRSTPIATAHTTQVQIAGPRDGQRLSARLLGGDRITATTVVHGSAEPSATVLVSSDCQMQGCQGIARVDGGGRWTARLRLVASLSNPRAALTALYADSDVGAAGASVAVRLKAPRPAPARRRPVRARAGAGSRAPAASTATSSPRSARTGAAPRTLIMIGDSLAEGTRTLLPAYLPGWSVTTDALKGRPLATGMQILAGTAVPSRPVVLAFSLFTNDSPSAVSSLVAAVRESVRRAGASGCAVWATIVRPAQGGVSYAAANARLVSLAQGELAGHLIVVPWAEGVAQHPDWLAGDGVHGTPIGYRARAEMYAQAARACGG